MARANPFRFSTKYLDNETDLAYYGYRYNNASTGRWITRDPLSERVADAGVAGEVLGLQPSLPSPQLDSDYSFVCNCAVTGVDPSGLVRWYPNTDIGAGQPFGAQYPGRLVSVSTDKNTKITAFRPNDAKTYNCHGYTFDGFSAKGGPYSIFDDSVLPIIQDEGWVHVCCGMAAGGIVLFGEDARGMVSHSGKIVSIVHQGFKFDEAASQVRSKYGPFRPELFTYSLAQTAHDYRAKYKCYVRRENVRNGCCPIPGDHEIAP